MSLRRGCLLVLAAAAVVLLLAAVVAYRALDPDAFRGLAERQATALLGEPVTIGHMRVRVFPVPAVIGTDVRTGSAGASDGPAVSVRAIRVLPAWRTLLSKPVVVDSIDIEGLAVTLRRDRTGRWILPGSSTLAGTTAKAPAGGGGVGGVPGLPGGPASDTVAVRRIRLRDGRVVIHDDLLRSRNGSAEIAAIGGIEADMVQRPDGGGTLSMRAALGGSPLTGTVDVAPQGLSASLQSPSLRSQDLPALFALIGSSAPAGLSIAGDTPLELTVRVARETGALTATGRARAGQVRLDTLTLANVAAPFRVANDTIVIEPLTFTAYGGTQRGRLEVRYAREPVTWALDSQIGGLDIDAFLTANTSARDRLRGTGQMSARLHGTTEAPVDRHMNGTVNLALSNGVIRNFALLAAINRALSITAGDSSDTRFERLSATLELAQGMIRTDNASLRAGELTVGAKGTITADRTIDMTGTAVFSRDASARMIATVRQVSGAKNDSGEVEVPFRVSGSTDRPAFAIDAQQMLGRAARKEVERNIRKGLDRFLRRH